MYLNLFDVLLFIYKMYIYNLFDVLLFYFSITLYVYNFVYNLWLNYTIRAMEETSQHAKQTKRQWTP